MRIRIYKSGYCLQADRHVTEHKGGGKRGKLTGKYSSASFKRLRSFCITHDVDADCWGVTLTVPGLDLIGNDEFKKLHHKLCVWCNSKAIPLVWRVELQQRQMPHLHLVVFSSADKVVLLCNHWFKLLSKLDPVYSLERIDQDTFDLCLVSRAFVNGGSHAIDIQRLNGDFRAWRYLVSHMSKAKQVQLGWHGRNWGVVNQDLFEDLPGIWYDVPDHVFYSVRRWVSRLTSGVPHKCKGNRRNKLLEKVREAKGKESKAFYKRRKVRNTTFAFWLGDPGTVFNMMRLAKAESESTPF